MNLQMVSTHGSIALILECLIKHPIGQQQIEVYMDPIIAYASLFQSLLMCAFVQS